MRIMAEQSLPAFAACIGQFALFRAECSGLRVSSSYRDDVNEYGAKLN